jgi:hypothetical protein
MMMFRILSYQRRDADGTSYFFRINMKAAEPGSDFVRW